MQHIQFSGILRTNLSSNSGMMTRLNFHFLEKRICFPMDFTVSALQALKRTQKIGKYVGFLRENLKAVEHEGD